MVKTELFQSVDVNEPSLIKTYTISKPSDPKVSPNGKIIYFSTPSELYDQQYEYDIFSYNIKNGVSYQLTTERSALFEPVIFHTKPQFASFEQVNWPDSPKKYILHIFTTEGQSVKTISLDIN